jgi:hypothetical protein
MTTSASWDDLHEDNKCTISEYVRVNRVNRLRMERLCNYRFDLWRTAPPGVAWLTVQLLLAVRHWGDPLYDGPRAEGLLRQFFDRVFLLVPQMAVPQVPQDDVNITAVEWAQVVFHIDEVRRIDGPQGFLNVVDSMYRIRAFSNHVPGQGRQRLLVGLTYFAPVRDANGQRVDENRPRAVIQYTGFLRWGTFNYPGFGRLREEPLPAQLLAQQPAQQHSKFDLDSNPYTTGISTGMY